MIGAERGNITFHLLARRCIVFFNQILIERLKILNSDTVHAGKMFSVPSFALLSIYASYVLFPAYFDISSVSSKLPRRFTT